MTGPLLAPQDLRWTLRVRIGLAQAKRALRRPITETASTPIEARLDARLALAAMVLLYTGLMSYWTVRNHYGFATSGFDLGIFEQGMWLLSRFKEPFVTVLGLNLFGDHTTFLLLPLVPLYWVAPSAATLLIAQSVALGGAAIPTFLIARDKLRSEWLAVGITLAYLAHPAVGWTNFENFHPDSFEIPLAMFAFFFMFRKRWRLFLGTVVALLLIKEDVALFTLPLGLFVAWRYDRKVGLITAGLSLVWFLTAVFVILPAFNQVGTLDAWRLPSAQFGGMGGLIKAIVVRPWDVLAIALSEDKPWYVWQLMGPLALLPLLAPSLLLIAAGPLLSNLMSTFWYQYHIQYHYSTLIVPVLVVAAVVAIARFRSVLRTSLVVILVLCSLITGFLWGPRGRHQASVADPDSPSAAIARNALALIPDDASVSAFYAYVPHLTHREHIYEFPTPFRAANWGDWTREGTRLRVADDIQYVLIHDAISDEADLKIIEDLRSDGWIAIYDEGGVELLESPEVSG